jgi:phage tail-like protein
MPISRDYPYSNHCFSVDLGDGEQLRGAIEVQLPDLCIDLETMRSGNEHLPMAPRNVMKPGYSHCTIRRAYQGDLKLYHWWRDTADGKDRKKTRRTVQVNLMTEDQQAVVTSWKMINAVPARYSFSPLSSRDGGALVESLEIAFESVEME